MTDHIPNDLSHLSDAEFNALCPQGEHAPGPQPLSPAALAVLDAAQKYEINPECYSRQIAAAVLRAVADEVVDAHDGFTGTRIHASIHAIADELEKQ
jgi:hypothetical protein